MKKLSCCGLLVLAALGCSNSKSETAASGKAEQAAPQPSNVAQADSSAQPVVTNGAGTEPGEVVALFLDSLRRGDENAANGVLTAQAQAELAKTDYVIQPLGTPEGTYKIGRVGYVDGDASVGLVECMWSEPNPEAGQPPIQLEIVCEVHKEEQGWRISGLAVKMSGTEETLVLDFENATSLQQALEQAGGSGAPAPSNAPQSNAPQSIAVGEPNPAGGLQMPAIQPPQGDKLALPTDPLSLPNQSPAQPSLNTQPTLDLQLPTQIALPPSDSSIKR